MQDLSKALAAARQAVDDAELDGELRVIGFSKALDALLEGQTVSTREEERPDGGGNGQHDRLGDLTIVEQIAARLSVAEPTIEHVFNLDGDKLEIVVAPGRLDGRAASATKEIALLTAAGRQAAKLEEWTPVEAIREWCEHYKRLDSSNFAATLKEMDDIFSFRGSPRKREVRMTAPAWSEATTLVKRLGGEP